MTLPTKPSEWKRLKRSPVLYYAKKIQGVEVKWRELTPEQKKEFQVAKNTEVVDGSIPCEACVWTCSQGSPDPHAMGPDLERERQWQRKNRPHRQPGPGPGRR